LLKSTETFIGKAKDVVIEGKNIAWRFKVILVPYTNIITNWT
jgi:hypothetical protein